MKPTPTHQEGVRKGATMADSEPVPPREKPTSTSTTTTTATPGVPAPQQYTPPSTLLFRLLPQSWIPYAELMRLDRPSGYYAFYWHYLIGLAFSACITTTPPPPAQLLGLAIYLAIWVMFFRGVTCTWNDNIDQDLDRQVARCANRPIARRAVGTVAGHAFTALLTVICGAMFLVFENRMVLVYAAIMTIVLFIYPFGKRITDFPQVILGFAFAIPVVMCPATLGADLLLITEGSGVTEAVRWGALCLYGANTLWTIIFDTVYAHQDIKDDIKAGVKSLAVRLGERTKLGLGVLSTIQVGLLVATGYLCDLSWSYFSNGCGGAALSLFGMLYLVDLERPESCAWWFGPGSKLVGASVVLGFLGHYFMLTGF